MPRFSMPRFSMPRFSMPRFSMPRFSMPRFSMPRFSMPRFSMPRFSVPRFVVPAAISIVVGVLLGAAAIFGTTLMVQQDTKPQVAGGDPQSSVLNRVEYGERG